MNTTINFQRTPASDGIHRHVYFNEFNPKDERLVSIGQLLLGTLFTFALVALYIGFKYLEG
jgi:hypothetical protein